MFQWHLMDVGICFFHCHIIFFCSYLKCLWNLCRHMYLWCKICGYGHVLVCNFFSSFIYLMIFLYVLFMLSENILCLSGILWYNSVLDYDHIKKVCLIFLCMYFHTLSNVLEAHLLIWNNLWTIGMKCTYIWVWLKHFKLTNTKVGLKRCL